MFAVELQIFYNSFVECLDIIVSKVVVFVCKAEGFRYSLIHFHSTPSIVET